MNRDRPVNASDRISRDVFVFSNSPVQRPLLKVADVESRFREVIISATTESIAHSLGGATVQADPDPPASPALLADSESALMDALFRILSCRRVYDDDRELAARINPANYKGGDKTAWSHEDITKKLSAVFNATPVFGTRTQTVLLVKWNGDAVWREKTMKEPIDPAQPEWEEKTFRIKFFG